MALKASYKTREYDISKHERKRERDQVHTYKEEDRHMYVYMHDVDAFRGSIRLWVMRYIVIT